MDHEDQGLLLLAVEQAASLCLSNREITILRMRFIEEYTLAEIGERFGISDTRVLQIERRSIKRLREALDENNSDNDGG